MAYGPGDKASEFRGSGVHSKAKNNVNRENPKEIPRREFHRDMKTPKSRREIASTVSSRMRSGPFIYMDTWQPGSLIGNSGFGIS
jgi:hypothetical protein